MLKQISIVAFGLLFAATPQAWAAGGGGGSLPSTPSAPARTLSPEEAAAIAYKKGSKAKEKAWKHEAKAAEQTDAKKQQKFLKRAQKEYTKSIHLFGDALKNNPRMAEAANELGYAYRKTGKYEKALGAYGYALKLKPNYMQAIEYLGEAYLALGTFDEVKKAYMTLFNNDQALAAQLMQAMTEWASDKGDASTSHQAFAGWIKERQGLANLTNDLSLNNTRAW